MSNIPEPLNVEEKYMHAMVMRLDALCHMMDSFVKEYAKANKVATTKNTVEKKPAPRKRATTKKVDDKLITSI